MFRAKKNLNELLQVIFLLTWLFVYFQAEFMNTILRKNEKETKCAKTFLCRMSICMNIDKNFMNNCCITLFIIRYFMKITYKLHILLSDWRYSFKMKIKGLFNLIYTVQWCPMDGRSKITAYNKLLLEKYYIVWINRPKYAKPFFWLHKLFKLASILITI